MATLKVNEGNGVAYQLSKLEHKTAIDYQTQETVHTNKRGLIKFNWIGSNGLIQNFGVTDVHYLISNPGTGACVYGSVRAGGTQGVLFPQHQPSSNYELRMVFLTDRKILQDTSQIKIEEI
jgi:hypothetical protein